MAHRCAGGLKKKVDIQSGSQRHKHFVDSFKVPVQHLHRAILYVLPRLDPSMTQRDSNSQPKDDPYAVILDNGQIHCAKGINTLCCLLRNTWIHGGPILLNHRVPTGIRGWYQGLIRERFDWIQGFDRVSDWSLDLQHTTVYQQPMRHWLVRTCIEHKFEVVFRLVICPVE